MPAHFPSPAAWILLPSWHFKSALCHHPLPSNTNFHAVWQVIPLCGYVTKTTMCDHLSGFNGINEFTIRVCNVVPICLLLIWYFASHPVTDAALSLVNDHHSVPDLLLVTYSIASLQGVSRMLHHLIFIPDPCIGSWKISLSIILLRWCRLSITYFPSVGLSSSYFHWQRCLRPWTLLNQLDSLKKIHNIVYRHVTKKTWKFKSIYDSFIGLIIKNWSCHVKMVIVSPVALFNVAPTSITGGNVFSDVDMI